MAYQPHKERKHVDLVLLIIIACVAIALIVIGTIWAVSKLLERAKQLQNEIDELEKEG